MVLRGRQPSNGPDDLRLRRTAQPTNIPLQGPTQRSPIAADQLPSKRITLRGEPILLLDVRLREHISVLIVLNR